MPCKHKLENIQNTDEDEDASNNQLETKEELVEGELETELDNQEVEVGLLGLDLVNDLDDFLQSE
jgi:hypothetical protein